MSNSNKDFPKKHIKKKFLLELEKEELEKEELESIQHLAISKEEITNEPSQLNSRIGEQIYLSTDLNYNYGGIIERLDGKICILPVPDFSLVYFNRAYFLIDLVLKEKKQLQDSIRVDSNLDETSINQVYAYYGSCSGFAIFLFCALESFINSLLPDDFEYKRDYQNKRTEIYNKSQIQRHIQFKEKVHDVLLQVTGKSFFSKQTSHTSRIYNLKEFRDRVVHTKNHSNQEDNRQLLKAAITFKYKSTLSSVAKFMNYYKPNYIEECPCNDDF